MNPATRGYYNNNIISTTINPYNNNIQLQQHFHLRRLLTRQEQQQPRRSSSSSIELIDLTEMDELNLRLPGVSGGGGSSSSTSTWKYFDFHEHFNNSNGGGGRSSPASSGTTATNTESSMSMARLMAYNNALNSYNYNNNNQNQFQQQQYKLEEFTDSALINQAAVAVPVRVPYGYMMDDGDRFGNEVIRRDDEHEEGSVREDGGDGGGNSLTDGKVETSLYDLIDKSSAIMELMDVPEEGEEGLDLAKLRTAGGRDADDMLSTYFNAWSPQESTAVDPYEPAKVFSSSSVPTTDGLIVVEKQVEVISDERTNLVMSLPKTSVVEPKEQQEVVKISNNLSSTAASSSTGVVSMLALPPPPPPIAVPVGIEAAVEPQFVDSTAVSEDKLPVPTVGNQIVPYKPPKPTTAPKTNTSVKKPLSCKVCSREYQIRKSCIDHLRKVHGILGNYEEHILKTDVLLLLDEPKPKEEENLLQVEVWVPPKKKTTSATANKEKKPASASKGNKRKQQLLPVTTPELTYSDASSSVLAIGMMETTGGNKIETKHNKVSFRPLDQVPDSTFVDLAASRNEGDTPSSSAVVANSSEVSSSTSVRNANKPPRPPRKRNPPKPKADGNPTRPRKRKSDPMERNPRYYCLLRFFSSQ
jgi:hypothetical protein